MSVLSNLSKDSKVLTVGPRSEGEIFNLVGAGFKKKNIRGLDLISYSPLISLGDMHAMPFSADSFDAVLHGWTFAYSNNRSQAVSEIVRVLRPGGIVAIGIEYNPKTAQEISSDLGYEVCDEDRIESVDQVLKMFEGHVGEVYFKQNPVYERKDDISELVVVMSVKK